MEIGIIKMITVKEYIELLKKIPQDAIIGWFHPDAGWYSAAKEEDLKIYGKELPDEVLFMDNVDWQEIEKLGENVKFVAINDGEY